MNVWSRKKKKGEPHTFKVELKPPHSEVLREYLHKNNLKFSVFLKKVVEELDA